MRAELIDPGGTLSPTVYSHALALHALAMLGVFIAAFVAIPTLVIRPGRGAIALGGLAFAVWAAVMMFFLLAAFAPDDWMTGSPLGPGALRAAVVALAIGVGLAIAQLAASLPANADAQSRRSAIAAVGAILALAIIGIPLATGQLPTTLPLLTASTLAVCSVVPGSIGSVATSIGWLAVVPCLAAAWIATAFLRAVHVSFLPDTVATLAPFPAMAGAVLAALFVAWVRGRTLRPQLARVAAVMFAGGTIATSTAFLVLGMRGLPRRYQQYEDAFQPLQIFVGVAAAVTLIGAIVAVRSIRASR
jgi:heme/copper-type cytochrome/quinol oxidase subunit 1